MQSNWNDSFCRTVVNYFLQRLFSNFEAAIPQSTSFAGHQFFSSMTLTFKIFFGVTVAAKITQFKN